MPEKPINNLKVTFVANGQISAPRDGWQRKTFSAYFDLFNGQRKLLFESNLSSSGIGLNSCHCETISIKIDNLVRYIYIARAIGS